MDKHMFIVSSRIRLAKRKECKLSRSACSELLGELRTEDTDTWAWGEDFQFLLDAIGRLDGGIVQPRTKIDDLSAETAGPSSDMPTQFAQDILLQFFRADTTELSEAEILAMYPDDSCAAQVALEELCDHNFLAVAQSGRADRLYAVTTEGQSLCFSCRD